MNRAQNGAAWKSNHLTLKPEVQLRLEISGFLKNKSIERLKKHN